MKNSCKGYWKSCNMTKPTVEDYFNLARIYGVADNQVLQDQVKVYQQEARLINDIHAYESFLGQRMHIPVRHWQEINSLDRKLSAEEVHILDLRDQAEENSQFRLSVTVDWLKQNYHPSLQ